MWALAGAIVQLPGTAVWLSAHGFQHAANQSPAICDLVVRYNDLLFSQVQQSVACNALHSLEARLCRWLLQAHDCVDGDIIPLTQEFLGQMLGVRRTTVTRRPLAPECRRDPLPSRRHSNHRSAGARRHRL
jgi:CRP-like cAMP-binding protein